MRLARVIQIILLTATAGAAQSASNWAYAGAYERLHYGSDSVKSDYLLIQQPPGGINSRIGCTGETAIRAIGYGEK